MSKSKQPPPPVGELRQSQVVTSFGPGSMVDLPKNSVLIGGLENWRGDQVTIHEERLERKVGEQLGEARVDLRAPPVELDGNQTKFRASKPEIGVYEFPTWFLVQKEYTYISKNGRKYRTRQMIESKHLQGGVYINEDKKKLPVVPVRFVQACTAGHISDVGWRDFASGTFKSSDRRNLYFDEGGAGNDSRDVYIRLAYGPQVHGRRRQLSDATVPDTRALGLCNGRQPWIRPGAYEPGCKNYARLLNRAASNAYFTQYLSVISIPERHAKLKAAVNRVYDDFLAECQELGDVRYERKKRKVREALDGYDDAAVWGELVRRRSTDSEAAAKTIKEVEIETLRSAEPGPDHQLKSDPDDYVARARELAALPASLKQAIESVVLVHKLREVVAQVGFTRFEASMPDINGELDLELKLAPLAENADWVPATENRGEGFFLGFSESAINAWLERPAVLERQQKLLSGFERWTERRDLKNAQFPGAAYIFLHTLSHMLITAVALECGYSASAIKERVYAGPSGYGILLLTGGSGSEGTLGGLVDVGRQLERHLVQALSAGRLCSNDPICSQHTPADAHEERFLHGAACHGCLLIAETSCERRNELLDRALVVPTLDTPDAAFFPDIDTLAAEVRHISYAPPPIESGRVSASFPSSGSLVAAAEPEPEPEPQTLEEIAEHGFSERGAPLKLEDSKFARIVPTEGYVRYSGEPVLLRELASRELVLIRHAKLESKGKPVEVAIGQFTKQVVTNFSTNEKRVDVYLRGVSPRVNLKLSQAEWEAFDSVRRVTIEGQE